MQRNNVAAGGQACWPAGFTSINGQTLALHMCAVPVDPDSAGGPPQHQQPPQQVPSREPAPSPATIQQQRLAQVQKQIERQQQQDQEERDAYMKRLEMMEKMYHQPHNGLPVQPVYTRGAPGDWVSTGHLSSVNASSPARVLMLLSRKNYPRAQQYEYMAKDGNNNISINMGVHKWLEKGSSVELGGYGEYKVYPNIPPH